MLEGGRSRIDCGRDVPEQRLEAGIVVGANKNVLNLSVQDASAALPQNCQTTIG